MSVLDTRRYFVDPHDAAFADQVQRGNVGRVEAALRAGQDVNAAGLQGFRPIHFVFAAARADVARVLLAAGADPNASIANGNQALHHAAQHRNADFTAVLLAFGGDPNACGAVDLPVLFAALDSPVPEQVLPLLVRAGADVDATWGNNTAVQSAMIGLGWKAAAALLALGADPARLNPHGEDAGAVFCSLLQRLQPTPNNRRAVHAVGSALLAHGLSLSCVAKLERFR